MILKGANNLIGLEYLIVKFCGSEIVFNHMGERLFISLFADLSNNFHIVAPIMNLPLPLKDVFVIRKITNKLQYLKRVASFEISDCQSSVSTSHRYFSSVGIFVAIIFQRHIVRHLNSCLKFTIALLIDRTHGNNLTKTKKQKKKKQKRNKTKTKYKKTLRLKVCQCQVQTKTCYDFPVRWYRNQFLRVNLHCNLFFKQKVIMFSPISISPTILHIYKMRFSQVTERKRSYTIMFFRKSRSDQFRYKNVENAFLTIFLYLIIHKFIFSGKVRGFFYLQIEIKC